MEMAKSITPNAISTILSNPSPISPSEIPDLVVQVVGLKPVGNRYKFDASDGKMKLDAIFMSDMTPEINLQNLKNLGLIRILDYTLINIGIKKGITVTKCEVVASELEQEIGRELKTEESEVQVKSKIECGIILKPKQDFASKSAAQIVHEQNQNMAPVARMAMTRRVNPLVSLHPYQGNWTIKVRLTNKGNLRTYKNARGEGHVFNVELTDQDGTQIQATMFNQAATKFYNKFDLGKVYYISKGTLKVANKQFKTVQNDYEMTLNENSEVEEVFEDVTSIPQAVYNFVKIDQLPTYINGKQLVDVLGVVQSVSTTMSIRRKSNDEVIPKRDITIADQTKNTVVVSLWGDLATKVGEELLNMVESSPIVAINYVKVGDFQGVSLSTVSRSTLIINPDVPESNELKSWYKSEGKSTSMNSIAAGMPSSNGGPRSFYTDRVSLSHITNNPSLGEGMKPDFFSVIATISFIKPDQTMWYRACKKCNKKVLDGNWCESCQTDQNECSLRYIMVMKVSDPFGEAWVSTFNEQAEKIVGCTADELNMLKQENEDSYQLKLKEALWTTHLFRVSVTQNEYMGEKKQRVTVRSEARVDFAAESKFLLEEMSKLQAS